MTEPTNINGLAKTKTEAPTSGTTQTAAETGAKLAGKLTEDEFDFVQLAHQHYNIHGVLFTAEYAKDNFNMPVAQYKKFLNNDIVKAAISERGVPFEKEVDADSSWRTLALSARQIVVANTMLDLLDQRSYKKKLQDLGVKTQEWQAWLKEPAFAKYLDENTQSVLRNGQHEAALAIMDGVSRGDFKMIQLYLEYTERFVPKANNATNAVGEAIDAKRIIQQIIEIVIDEVEDHQVASRIADRMRNLAASTQMANQLTASGPAEIVMPEVVANRELTPAMTKIGVEL